MVNLTLLLPGLLGGNSHLPGADKPRFPAMEALLANARISRTPVNSFYHYLADMFGLELEEGGDLPMAPLSRLIDAADRPEGIWMRADPVHLAVGRDGMRLVDASSLALTQRDAIVYAATLEELFREYKLLLEVPLPDRWYVRLPKNAAVTSVEIDRVAGRDVRAYLPAGADGNEWIRLSNEVQMLLHDCELNRERELRGELTVNSLWFWGRGELPEIIPRRWAWLYSDDPGAQGLAMLSSTGFSGLPDSLTSVINSPEAGGEVLVASATLLSGSKNHDLNTWLAAMQRLEQHWFVPLLNAIRQKQLQAVSIITDGRVFESSRYAFLRFWRRQKAVTDYL